MAIFEAFSVCKWLEKIVEQIEGQMMKYSWKAVFGGQMEENEP